MTNDKATPRPWTIEDSLEDVYNQLGNLQNAYKCLEQDKHILEEKNIALLKACKEALEILEGSMGNF